MTELRRIQITHIHKEDAFYRHRDEYIGMQGTFKPRKSITYPGYFAGSFFSDSLSYPIIFFAIRYKKI